jgi:hypothetical protein
MATQLRVVVSRNQFSDSSAEQVPNRIWAEPAYQPYARQMDRQGWTNSVAPVWNETDYRSDVRRITNDAHIDIR